MNESLSKQIDALFEELVPSMGKADTEAGEIVRAYCRIAHRWFNDGDKLGIGYGNETCNAAGRYLMKHDHGEVKVLEPIFEYVEVARVPVFVWPMPTSEGLFVVEHQDGTVQRAQPDSLTFLGSKELFDQFSWEEE